MKLSTRALVSAVVSATVAFGVAPQALAAPGGHGHAAHATAHGKGRHGAAAAGTDHKLTNAQKKTAREASRKDKALARAVSDTRLSRLSAGVADAVRANVLEDRTSLAALADQAAAATTPEDLAAAAALVHAVRPEGYRLVVNQLRHAAKIQAAIDAALALDPAAATADAQTLVDSATTKALAYRASDPRSALRSIQSDLAAAEAALDGTDDSTDPTDPAPTDPAPTDPAPTDPAPVP